MEGSGPPVSQELVYVREDLETSWKTLLRLYDSAQEPIKTQIFNIAWDLAMTQARLGALAQEARAHQRPLLLPGGYVQEAAVRHS